METTPRANTILFAEDDSAIRTLLARTLEHSGFRVIAAADGAEAALLSQSHEFDLLLTDIIMPGLDGYRLAERLRRSRAWLPVVFISGFAEAAIVAERDPSAKVFRKPLNSSDLIQTIQELLAQTAHHAATEGACRAVPATSD